MTLWSDRVLGGIERSFAEAADGERAMQMAAYMKDRFVFYGIPAGPRRKLAKQVTATLDRPDARDVLALANAAWQLPERELHYTAVDLLAANAELLDPSGLAALRDLITHNSWWDTVDALASHVVGGMVQNHPELVGDMDVWIRDDNLWVARTALLHQLRYGASTDQERLFAYCLVQAGHPDFFIRKAIGWALRQYARDAPDDVRRFVAEHEDVLSPLSIREAGKHL